MSAAEIEQESEQRRAHVAALVDELRVRVSPGAIVNELIGPDAGRELAQFAAQQIRRQVQRNPVPIAIIGIGIAWLLLSDALLRQRQVPLHDGLDPADFDEGWERPGILSGTTRVIRHRSKVASDEKNQRPRRQA